VHVIDTADYAALLAGRRVECVGVPDPQRLHGGGLIRPRRTTISSTQGSEGVRRRLAPVAYRPATGPVRTDIVTLTKDLGSLERALRSHRALNIS
jgi:hypothetical protein